MLHIFKFMINNLPYTRLLYFEKGGFDGKIALSSVERFDTNKRKWMKIASLIRRRGGVGLAVIAGKIYATGGHDGNDYLDSVEVYNPETEK